MGIMVITLQKTAKSGECYSRDRIAMNLFALLV